MTRTAGLRAVAAFVLAFAVSADAGWWDEAGAARRTTLDEIRKDPDRWRDVTVVLDVRFARVVDVGNPYFTRFTSRDWRAVAAFAADASTETMSTAAPFERIFVRRGSECERRLADVGVGRRVQLRAAVRDSVKGDPWIETIDVVADGDPLTPEESSTVARADEFLARANAAGAEPIYRGLVAKRALPKAVQADLWRKIAAACWAQRRHADAVDAYTAALAVEPNDASTVERLAVARAAIASSSTTTSSSSVSPTPPAPPAPLGAPFVLPPAPSRRLLPPTAMSETLTNDAGAPTARPPVAERTSEPAPTPDAPAPPAAPPKPQLAGPK